MNGDHEATPELAEVEHAIEDAKEAAEQEKQSEPFSSMLTEGEPPEEPHEPPA
ncbi:hypothetical protein SAMN05421504_104503 [Amycolatopsis xylanica]|uniref:Uncharacterized protein n=1 Tax=Amycolatopsis xylanica TaxID=589385 RepID=A0A1H3H451_9PSEU|nr:hypothetical protein [Amycolatopsis xylanica]SDY10005.1 hypothetical protein SAMN05421504_104503 [Amycolatopsis xylanica]